MVAAFQARVQRGKLPPLTPLDSAGIPALRLKNTRNVQFASEIGIAPGIVVGRLQHDGKLPPSHCNELKCRLEWVVDAEYFLFVKEILMNCGLRVVYAYTQSDEISLLLHRDEEGFGRKLRKLNSVLAGEASAKLSFLLGRRSSNQS